MPHHRLEINPDDIAEINPDIEGTIARLTARWDAEYAAFVEREREHHAAEDEPVKAPKRQRKVSIGTTAKRLRRAGENGPLRFELADGIVVTTTRDATPSEMTVDDAERLWLERIGHAH